MSHAKGSLKNRVKVGIRYLDKHRPGWYRKIHTGRLDMSDVCNDILGQLFGHYLIGLSRLKIPNVRQPNKAINLGFRGETEEESEKLKHIWTELIQEKIKKERQKLNYTITKDDKDSKNK